MHNEGSRSHQEYQGKKEGIIASALLPTVHWSNQHGPAPEMHTLSLLGLTPLRRRQWRHFKSSVLYSGVIVCKSHHHELVGTTRFKIVNSLQQNCCSADCKYKKHQSLWTAFFSAPHPEFWVIQSRAWRKQILCCTLPDRRKKDSFFPNLLIGPLSLVNKSLQLQFLSNNRQ